jgi:hypothetical protein
MKLRKFFLIAVPIGAAAWWLWSNSRAATKTPQYKLISLDGPLEIRDYPPLTIVKAPMSDGEMDSSFRMLFRYITGYNARREKIEMTTPVLLDSANGSNSMAFIMPPATVAQGVPTPADYAASIAELPAARYAVLRFQGSRSRAGEAEAIHALRSYLAARHLTPAGDPVIAYYDPPWTPFFLRRNEVLIPIAA